ncbi:MAG: NAD(P)-dependent oxidoreductase, partial [Chloroflexota bacterium]
MMRIILTGGSGDLGRVIAKPIAHLNHEVVRLDIRVPQDSWGEYVNGSILDRNKLKDIFSGSDLVVHIAAWHGIHERKKSVFDFWDLNVTGTLNVFEICAQVGVNKVIFISSTSVEDQGIYGRTKVLGEAIAEDYAARHGINIINLRPRAFIPHWNRAVYETFIEWA